MLFSNKRSSSECCIVAFLKKNSCVVAKRNYRVLVRVYVCVYVRVWCTCVCLSVCDFARYRIMNFEYRPVVVYGNSSDRFDIRHWKKWSFSLYVFKICPHNTEFISPFNLTVVKATNLI